MCVIPSAMAVTKHGFGQRTQLHAEYSESRREAHLFVAYSFFLLFIIKLRIIFRSLEDGKQEYYDASHPSIHMTMLSARTSSPFKMRSFYTRLKFTLKSTCAIVVSIK